MSECNDCLGSVQLQQGPAGPKGTTGSTGPQGPQGPQGPAGAASTVPGPPGDDGTSILYTLEEDQEITDLSYATALPETWTVTGGTLDTDGNTLRLTALTLPTLSDLSLTGMKIQVDGTDVRIGLGTGLFDYPNIKVEGPFSYRITLDIVRFSSIGLRLESHLQTYQVQPGYSDYSSEVIVPMANNLGNVFRTSQTMTVNLANDFDVDILLETDSALRPVKLLTAKLELLKKA